MQKLALVVLSVAVFSVSGGVALAKPQGYAEGGKTYYVVTSADKSMDSGDEVCAMIGKTCVGYTAFNSNVCKQAHKNASTRSDANGSKAGFYCDGSPQGGVCANEENTCHICPNCNVGVTCSESIGSLYREMYVECTPGDEMATSTKLTGWLKDFWGVSGQWWGNFRSTVAKSFDQYRQNLSVLLQQKKVTRATIQVQGPKGKVDVNIPEDSYVCEFFQQNKKLVTCSALAKADGFCVAAFGSRFAKAELCQDDGVIVCSKPCTTNPQELAPQRCAFDGDRSRGNQAKPLDFCTKTETIKVDTNGLGKKKAGQVCAHGGECNTGYCLGQTSDSGIKYFCSCKQSTLDFTCGK